ncbi:MAG: RNA polymerase sigma factor [Pirellulales bacterium]
MDQQQEHQIAHGLRNGQADAWRMLYDAFAKRVWISVARLMGTASADVADVVQETFLAAARSAHTYDSTRGSLWLWLYGIARNHVALHYRSQARQNRLKEVGPWLASGREQMIGWLENRQSAPSHALATAEVAARVRSALTELPADYETLLTAKYLDGVTVEQLAGQEKCSSTALRSKLARARRAFRQVFLRAPAGSADGRAREAL